MGRGLLLWLVGVPIPVIILCGFSFIEPSFREAFRFAEVRCPENALVACVTKIELVLLS
jgi:hypothetical protein